MKYFKRSITVLLALVVVFTSVCFTEVSAGTTGAKKQLSPVKNLFSRPGYKAIYLFWDRVKDADGYIISQKINGEYKAIATVKNRTKGRMSYKVKGMQERVKYRFKVNAFYYDKTRKDGKFLSTGVFVNGSTIREMAYRLNVKTTTSIRPKGGSGKYLKIRNGDLIDATKFTAGRYAVIKDGNVYYIPKTYVRKATAIYSEKANYTVFSAEEFINDKQIDSKTGILMWVSTYTQHTYMFKGSKGKWKCVDHWECATGQASSPTPTGISGIKRIHDKISYRNGLRWWSPFSSMNSFHSMRSSWVTGAPASNGCVRTPTDKCKKVYEYAPIGTTVLVF